MDRKMEKRQIHQAMSSERPADPSPDSASPDGLGVPFVQPDVKPEAGKRVLLNSPGKTLRGTELPPSSEKPYFLSFENESGEGDESTGS